MVSSNTTETGTGTGTGTGLVPFPRFVEDRTVYELVSSLHIATGILMVAVNAAILTAFLVQRWRRPTAVQLTPPSLLVLNLVIADTLLGAFVITEMVASRYKKIVLRWAHWCTVIMGFSYLTGLGSYLALINVVVDRYLAIRYTLLYRERMTLKRGMVMVTCGWLIPVAGFVGAVASIDPWNPGQITCWEIPSFNRFLRYGYVPSLFASNVCVVGLQCLVLSVLRRYDAKRARRVASQIFRRYSDKSARILCRVTAPTCVAMICYDVVLIVNQLWINQVTTYMYHVTLLLVLVSFLMNPIVYSYGTANIRKPIVQLCRDLKNRLNLGFTKTEPAATPQTGISVIRTEVVA